MPLSDLEAANLCAATYWRTEVFDAIISHETHDSVWIGVKKYPDFMVAACRGSVTLLDWYHDFMNLALMEDDADLGRIHPGGMAGVRPALAALGPMIDRPLKVIGHSLGALHACNIAALYSVNKGTGAYPVLPLTLFGCPRPGGVKLKMILSAIGAVSYCNGHDPFCKVPFYLPPLETYMNMFDFSMLDHAPTEKDTWGHEFGYHHIQNYIMGLGGDASSWPAF